MHHMRLQHIAAVHHRRNGPHQLKRRDFKGLSKGSRGKGGIAVGIGKGGFIKEDAAGLASQLNAGFLRQAELMDVFIELFAPQPNADVGKGHVAGILQGLGGTLLPMARRTPAMERPGAALDGGASAAIKAVEQAHRTFFQCRSQGDALKGGTWLIAVGDHSITPLGQPGIGHGGIVGGQQLLLQLPGFLHGRLILIFQFLRRLGVVNYRIVVGIVAPQGRHGENIPGVHVHHHPECAVLHIVLGNGLLHMFFQHLLHGLVDGQYHVAAVDGVGILLKMELHLRSVVALRRGDGAAGAGEGLIFRCFDAVKARIVAAHKAQNLRRQGTIGIIPAGVRLQIHAGDGFLA